MTEKETQLFFEHFTGKPAQDFFVLPQSGSSRKNFVAKSDERKFIVTYNENLAENESFI